jgi:hypothetical protein
MKVCGQLHVPAVSPSGKEPSASIESEAGWVPEPVWTRRKREKIPLVPPPGVQPVA